MTSRRPRKAAPATPLPGRMVTTTEAAAIVGLSPRTMRERRFLGQSPAWYKIGTNVRYDLDELARFLASCHIIPDTE